jgi:hypothetical protein
LADTCLCRWTPIFLAASRVESFSFMHTPISHSAADSAANWPGEWGRKEAKGGYEEPTRYSKSARFVIGGSLILLFYALAKLTFRSRAKRCTLVAHSIDPHAQLSS